MHATKFRAAIAAVALLAFAAPAVHAKPVDAPVTEAELAADIKVLAGDAFEGRAPGTEGEDRTIAWIVGQWAKLGLEPVPGSATPWLQPVPLVESQSVDGSVRFKSKGREVKLAADSLILTGRDPSLALADVPVVFVGYGVDGAGKVNADVAGKLAVLLYENAPFGEKLPRYRERRQMLADAGAAGVLVVAPDSLPWEDLRAALGSKSVRLASAKPGAQASGFIAQPALQTLLGKQAEAALAAATSADYRGLALPLTADLSATTTVRPFASHNVIARLPGAKPDGKAVLFLGHWDHLGICGEEGDADRICNGAVDNASGIAGLVTLAQAFKTAGAPDRSIVFLAVTAEESGLLGSKYYAENPVFPLAQTVGGVNMDALNAVGPAKDIVVVGGGKSELDAYVAKLAKMEGRTVKQEPTPEKGFYYRSDHFSFAKLGVPMFNFGSGDELVEGGVEAGKKAAEDYEKNRYHAPGDEYEAITNWDGMMSDLRLYYAAGRMLAMTDAWPNWVEGDEFRAARDKSRAGK